MALSAAEREVFEAQVLLDEGKAAPAADRALKAMLTSPHVTIDPPSSAAE